MKKFWRVVTSMVLVVAAVGVTVFQFNRPSEEIMEAVAAVTETTKVKAPKYVFLFIGDGMSYPQIQIASDYLGVKADTDNDDILDGNEALNFMNFETAGSAITYDSSSFCPDSASTATSISTGHKTYSGVINMNETKNEEYETIAEQLKEQLNYKIGIISSVNLNHATPAAFYGHQASRNNYYELGLEMIESNFDYFAGGALKKADGEKGNLYELAKEAGYNVVTTRAGANALTEKSGKTIVIAQDLADSDSINYELDRKSYEWSLADYVEKGIEVLDNETGFFMMVEGGKIDWACHANDAGSTIADTVALAKAVDKAIEFYKEHKDETLILVTGDHETGGLTIGFAGTNYDTFLTNLENQKISYAKYDSSYVSKYKEQKTSFDTVLKDIKRLFGLMTSEDAKAESNPNLVLTEYELGLLKNAYNKTLGNKAEKMSEQEEYVLYGTYEPLTVTITHILNNKSGINFSSYSHTGLPVAVLAQGEGSDLFEGYYDNTDIYNKLASLLGVQQSGIKNQ
ncbi:MAG: alkaline phosphatase [Lachnospiraceae bacterium]|nr:alkaline phosphatase [Lachnospiraceae bacterium]